MLDVFFSFIILKFVNLFTLILIILIFLIYFVLFNLIFLVMKPERKRIIWQTVINAIVAIISAITGWHVGNL